MARKTDPTKPTKNADGKDVYRLSTIGDLVVLYHHLPPEKRELLLSDIANGLKTGAENLDKAPAGLVRSIIAAGLRVSPINWIDDDKGKVMVTVKMTEDGDALFSKEL